MHKHDICFKDQQGITLKAINLADAIEFNIQFPEVKIPLIFFKVELIFNEYL